MTIRQQIIARLARNHPQARMTPKYITIHTTGNRDHGATAAANANYLSNGSGGRQASWHYSVDDKEAVQSMPNDWQGWHCGDGSGAGNTTSIGIEMCVNDSTKWAKVVDNTATLVVKLMKEYNIDINHVVQHNHWSGKNCPLELRESTWGISWNDFINTVKGKLTPSVAPAGPSTPAATPTFKVNQKVKIKTSAKNYATGQTIPDSVKNKTYTVQQVETGKVLIKEIVSWVKNSDLTAVATTSAPAPALTYNVGTKVKVKMSASKYATGQNIPASVKGKTYTVQQEESTKVLLKEITSWVKKTDLERP